MYSVKELFYSIQGEGARSGRPAVFLRFAGCNLWSGREQDRASAICRFCDTNFVGTDGPQGGKFSSPEDLAQRVASLWPGKRTQHRPYVVCTGGEPLLQLDVPLISALHARGFEIALETNGTLPAPEGIDWICMSPKMSEGLQLTRGDELKLVYPQQGIEPEVFLMLDFTHFYLQPMDGPDVEANTKSCLAYCLRHPEWSLSLQMHKMLGIP